MRAVQRTGVEKVKLKDKGKAQPIPLNARLLNPLSKLLGNLLRSLLRSQPRSPQQLQLRFLLLMPKVRAVGKEKVKGEDHRMEAAAMTMAMVTTSPMTTRRDPRPTGLTPGISTTQQSGTF